MPTTHLNVLFVYALFFFTICNTVSCYSCEVKKITTLDDDSRASKEQYSKGEEFYQENGVSFKRNHFGDIFPFWEDIPNEKLTEKLLTFVDTVKEKGSPIMIEIPHEKLPILNAVMNSNFTLHYADQRQSVWIFRNSSSIPYPFTAIGGACIWVIKNGKVLVIEERTKKGILGLPAGGADPAEFVRETACRELCEETGLIVQPQDLKLIALVNRKNANKQGASLYGYCFITEDVQGSVKIDPKEVAQAFWIPITDLAKNSEIQNLKISPLISTLAKHILDGCHFSDSLKLPVIHQTTVFSDSKETMDVELFQLNLKNN